MASSDQDAADGSVRDYRHTDSKRKNNPPAGLSAQGRVDEKEAHAYRYDPHLPPKLRFDQTGAADELPALLQKATSETLTNDEAQEIAGALRQRQPWLEWTGKRRKPGFEVDPVALNTHERVSAQAISCARSSATMCSASCLLTRSCLTTRPCSSTSTTWIGRTASSWVMRWK